MNSRTVWATLTTESPSLICKAFLLLESVSAYSMDRATMLDNGRDCVTAYLTPLFGGRRLLMDFTVLVKPTTSDPGALAQCQLCCDSSQSSEPACRGVNFASGTKARSGWRLARGNSGTDA